MKKVLALVLAVMMLATVAFAEILNPGEISDNGFKNYLPGATIKVNDSGVVTTGNNQAGAGSFILANDVPAGYNEPTYNGATVVKTINSTNYALTGIKYTEGKKLVKSIDFNNAENRVEIKLYQDYSKTSSSNLNVEFTLKGKKVEKSFKPGNLNIRIRGTVGYKLQTGILQIQASDDVIVLDPIYKNSEMQTNGIDIKADLGISTVTPGTAFAYTDQLVWKVEKASNAEHDYGDLDFTAADGDTDIAVRVYNGDKHYLYNDIDADKDILKAYADADADITFLNFPAEPTFNSTATVYFYKEEDTHVYGLKDGKLVKINAKWSDDDGAFVLKTRTLGSYVFSDKPLNISAPAAGSENPDTGANDVVGIATALAAVALVSAAAVSLKK